MEYIENIYSEGEISQSQMETLMEDLTELRDHPMDLNDPSENYLRKLPFLNDKLIKELMLFLQYNSPLVSIYELKNVKGLDYETIQLLLPFVQVVEKKVQKMPITVHNLFKYGRNDFIIRYDQCFQQKAGYGDYSDSVLMKSPNKKYLGEPFYQSVRYGYNFYDRVGIKFVAEKDFGEAFWNREHKGYDFYSGSFILRDIGVIESLVAGDFKATFGRGLIMSQGFYPGRSMLITQSMVETRTFRAHGSTNEVDFLRGAAGSLRLGNVSVGLFYSKRQLDASVEDSSFTSIKTDGYHRIPLDMEKRRRVPMQTMGGTIRWQGSHARIGFNAVYYTFDSLRMRPSTLSKRTYPFEGKSNLNMSVDYLFKSKSLMLCGEYAMSKNGGMATVHDLSIVPVSYVSFLASVRYFSKKYHTFFGNQDTQGSALQNEEGVYMGMQLSPIAHWNIKLLADIAHFPRKRYGVDAPSVGKSYRAESVYTQGDKFSTSLRYSYLDREKNVNDREHRTSIIHYRRNRLRCQMNYRLSSWFSGKLSFEGIGYQEQNDSLRRGWMISKSISFSTDRFPLEAHLSAAYFDTDDYATRIYAYEKSPLYTFSMPSFYGEGIRLSLYLRWKICRQLWIACKLSHSQYFDRDHISSGTEMISGKIKQDLIAMLRCKF